MGWYMYCVASAETVLLVVGLHLLAPARTRSFVTASLIFCLAALDLYTVNFVSIPYYTGIISHNANGSLKSVHLTNFTGVGLPEITKLLSANKPAWISPASIGVAWIAYLIVTALIVCLPVWLRDKTESTTTTRAHSATSPP